MIEFTKEGCHLVRTLETNEQTVKRGEVVTQIIQKLSPTSVLMTVSLVCGYVSSKAHRIQNPTTLESRALGVGLASYFAAVTISSR